MSTRATIHFHDNWSPDQAEAIIYRHGDGYPDGQYGVVADLAEFFSEVKCQTSDTRFDDASYLAAKFVVWQASRNGSFRSGKPLDFLSIGILREDPGDIDYRYHVRCGKPDENGLPQVDYERS